jgi:hypothetical protein
LRAHDEQACGGCGWWGWAYNEEEQPSTKNSAHGKANPNHKENVVGLFRKHKNELGIPPIAAGDADAVEIARIWAAEGSQHVSLSAGLWEDPAAWGIMLVDLAKHVANAYAESEGHAQSRVLQRIRDGFDAEWENPTSTPTGHFMP